MIEIITAIQSDLDFVNANPLYAVEAKTQEKLGGIAYTATVGDEIIAIGGAVIFWPGVAEAWVKLSKNAEYHRTEIALCCKSITECMIKDNNLRFLEACISCDFAEAIALVEALGFERKCKLEGYMENGGDAYLYTMVIK